MSNELQNTQQLINRENSVHRKFGFVFIYDSKSEFGGKFIFVLIAAENSVGAKLDRNCMYSKNLVSFLGLFLTLFIDFSCISSIETMHCYELHY